MGDQKCLLESHFKELRQELEAISTCKIAQFETEIRNIMGTLGGIRADQTSPLKGLSPLGKTAFQTAFSRFFRGHKLNNLVPRHPTRYNISVSLWRERNLKLSLEDR